MKKPIIALLVFCLAFFSFPGKSSAQSNENQAVLLRSGVVLLPENTASFDQKDVLHKNEVVGDHFYRLIQFTQIPSADQHRALEEAGIQLLDYIPHKAYIASLPTSIQAEQLQALGIRSIMAIPQKLKMADNLRDRPFPEWALKKGKVDVLLKYYSSIPEADILAFCRIDGIEVIRHNGLNNFMRVAIAEDRLETVSGLPYVAYLELAPAPGEPGDVPGRGLHRSNVIDTEFPSGRHYTGEEVKVLVRDDGIVGPHIDFHGRISQEDVNGDGGVNHADAVAGNFAGAGNRNPRIRGMAAGAFIYVINYQPDFLDNTLPLHIDSDVLVTNTSYSNGCNDGYTSNAATVDQQLHDYPTFLHVFSAGNSNNQDCNYGAGNQWGTLQEGINRRKCHCHGQCNGRWHLVNSSSRGPAYDGRLKPDISANGGSQFSTDPDNEYSAFSGTSAAAPGIAGVTAQLHQAYREANPGEIAEGALLKAIMLNTANDLGNPGPDFKFGWGHVNAYRAALAIEENRFFSGTIDQDGANSHQITIPEGVKKAKIMVYWNDKEASELALKALVANLDAQVTNENGEVFQPLVLDPTPSPAILNLPAVPGVDSLNNMEQISLTEPPAGEYTLTIDGTEVPFAGQKYWVVYEFITDEITVTYPIGGEGLVPGENEIIHWDTYGAEGNFLLEYSLDSMTTWTAIGTLNGAARLYNWIVPGAVVTGKAFVRVTRDTVVGQSQQPFSIVNVPANLEVTQACPGFIRLEWDAVPGATAYDVFLLGELYMDSIATTTELLYDVPTINFNPTLEHWLSVRAVGEEGVRGRRAVAIPWNAGLLNCPLDNDVAITGITSPPALLSSCGSLDIAISVNVLNNGATEQTDVQVTYQLGNEAPVTEVMAGPYSRKAPPLAWSRHLKEALFRLNTGRLTTPITVSPSNPERISRAPTDSRPPPCGSIITTIPLPERKMHC
ncbi:MAG: S8 family serine peptidase [Saprospirales bacterium]|nr:S8 family serine peptidase [Saprospirales bacterium]